MRILQINTYDQGGGAEAVVSQLHRGFRARNHDAWLAVGAKYTDNPHVLLTRSRRRRSKNGWADAWWKLRAKVKRARGREHFNYPETWRLLDLPPARPEILQCHNLHGHFDSSVGYFDLRALPWLSRHASVVLTLHDSWLLSGHCAHPIDCERWKSGCGRCPDLTLYPFIERDATAANWRLKRRILAKCRLNVVAPCQWLMDKVDQSILAPAIARRRVICNGVDLSIFRPGDKQQARATLGLPSEKRILLFAANGVRSNPWKDYQTVRDAAVQAAQQLRGMPVEVVMLGENAPAENVGGVPIRFVPFLKDPRLLATYYQAADIYLHAAVAETSPMVIIEAQACGCPVVATRVGGIPELIEDNVTGFLTSPRDAADMAGRICQILSNENLRMSMASAAARRMLERHDGNQQVSAYLHFYEELIQSTVPAVQIRLKENSDRWPSGELKPLPDAIRS